MLDARPDHKSIPDPLKLEWITLLLLLKELKSNGIYLASMYVFFLQDNI